MMAQHNRPHPERKKLGTVIHVSLSTGNLIMRANEDVSIGEPVYDSNGKRVGNVFDFFGPMLAPFIAVKPSVEDPSKVVGSDLWLIERPREKRREKKRRR